MFPMHAFPAVLTFNFLIPHIVMVIPTQVLPDRFFTHECCVCPLPLSLSLSLSLFPSEPATC